MTITANLHNFTVISANKAPNEDPAWLEIRGEHSIESFTVFMPYDLAQRLEATFNEWQREQDAAAEQAGVK